MHLNSAIRRRLPRGFTLIEVLISIAIALVLIIGISQIFAMAQQTSGAGATLLKSVASERTIQATLTNDFRDIVTGDDSPGMVIASYSVAAFRNKQDMLSNRAGPTSPGGGPLYFNDPSGTGSLPLTGGYDQAFSVNDRIHRTDRICFYAHDLFHRQTGDAPNYVSSTTSSEAFIWIGHLALPNNDEITNWDPMNPASNWQGQSKFMTPGAPGNATISNDNNLYASDWILGRQIIALVPRPFVGGLPETGYTSPVPGVSPTLSTAASGKGMAALSSLGGIPIFASRYDLSYTPLSICKTFNSLPGTKQTWWEDQAGIGLGVPPGTGPVVAGNFVNNDRRYYANPFPTKPASYSNGAAPGSTPAATWMSAAAAQTAPIFVRGCSQFIVEYAGNYLHQDQDPHSATYGEITDVGPDPSGKLDFIAVLDQNGNPTRQIRWYGFPRDVDGDGKVNVNVFNNPIAAANQPVGGFDVVPLVNVVDASGVAASKKGPAVFEKAYPADFTAPISQLAMAPAVAPSYPDKSAPYVCAWDPGVPANLKPKMIRIIIGIDDPSGNLNSAQIFEYVFTLP